MFPNIIIKWRYKTIEINYVLVKEYTVNDIKKNFVCVALEYYIKGNNQGKPLDTSLGTAQAILKPRPDPCLPTVSFS